MIGVIAAANTVPGRQNIGTTNAAVALAAPAIRSVLSGEAAAALRCSSLHAPPR